jgi:hypothetical protein
MFSLCFVDRRELVAPSFPFLLPRKTRPAIALVSFIPFYYILHLTLLVNSDNTPPGPLCQTGSWS